MDIAKHIHSNIFLVTGHYGCGKTNISINLAMQLSQAGVDTTVIDLDIVNPYFRISDSNDMLQDAGVKVVAPNFAGTALDTPSLSPHVQQAIAQAGEGLTTAILDVGGDPEGATTLGRYRHLIAAHDYQMVYVVNQRRLQTTYATEATELLDEIEQKSGLHATQIIGNTHLKGETTAQVVVDSIPFAQGVSELTGLPLEFITAPRAVCDEVNSMLVGTSPLPPEVMPVDIYVKTPWD